MRVAKYFKIIAMISILIFLSGMMSACKDKDDPTVPTEDQTSQSLISDGVKWTDATYIYAQDNGTNPLMLVEYDKGDFSNAVLSKTIDFSTEAYQKLAFSIKGQYYIQLNIISKKYEVSSETTESFKIKLTDEYVYYEIDLTDEDYSIFKDLIVRIELIATPGAKDHFGSFQVNQMAFDETEMTIDTYKDDNDSPGTNLYQTMASAFNFNDYWTGSKHILTVSEKNSYHKVDYSILPGPDVKLITDVSGDFSDFNYINFQFKGDDQTKLKVTVKTTYKEAAEVIPFFEITLNGELQDATLYLNELSATTRDSITQVQIYIENDTLIPSTGEFEIRKAEFNIIASTGQSLETINYYSGDKQDFNFNQLWLAENGLLATFDETDDDVSVSYTKQSLSSAIYSHVDGKLSDFDYININVTAEPYAEFLFQITTRWSERLDHHMVADEFGEIGFTMSFALHYFDLDIDGIEGFRIIPDVNQSSSTGGFTINNAEFSNTAAYTYTVTDEIEIQDWREVGTVFDVDTASNDISWIQQDGYYTLYSRVYGPFVSSNQFVYKYIDFEAVVSQDTQVTFEVDGAEYDFVLTAGQTKYRIILADPTTGTADTWKFTGGFILYLHIDASQAGAINLSTLQFTNDPVPTGETVTSNLAMFTSVVNKREDQI